MAANSIDDITRRLAQTKVVSHFELSFKGKGLKLDKAEDAKELVDEIEKCSNMTALCMEGNTLGVEAAQVISTALSKHPEFEKALWSDMFTGRLKMEIPSALKHLGDGIMLSGCKLVVLDLSDNAFGPRGLVGLVDLLMSPSCFTLTTLRLNNNGLGIGGGKVFVSGRNRLENDGATALAAVFKAIGTLEELSMPQNGITLSGIKALMDAISVNTKLRVLNLNDNTFTEQGGKEMAKVLPCLQELEVVNLGDCLLRSEGIMSVASALQGGHTKMKELILSGNEVTSSAAVMATECLANKPDFTLLDLNANQLGEGGKELVWNSLEAMGKFDVLASLSDDEGTDDESNDDDDEGSQEEDEESVDDADDYNADVTVTQKVLESDFLSFPSTDKLLHLGPDRVQLMKDVLMADVNDTEKVVQTIMRVSLVVNEDDSRVQGIAYDIADGLLSHVFDKVECAATQVPNAVLVYLGLLKSEDKSFKPPACITGPLMVLNHVVQQPYFPSAARDTLLYFLSK